jgi:ParB-like chromosome segregation protein Spo0J
MMEQKLNDGALPKIELVPIGSIHKNPKNPRIIKDGAFKKLVKSIKDFQQMLFIRPVVVDSESMILGGNMRWEAAKEAGRKDVPIIRADDLTEEQKREFIIKDNVSGGAWDWSELANNWDAGLLNEWGLDAPVPEPIELNDGGAGGNADGNKVETCPKCGFQWVKQ